MKTSETDWEISVSVISVYQQQINCVLSVCELSLIFGEQTVNSGFYQSA